MSLELLIALLPVVALVAALARGRYPGEERLARARRRHRLAHLVARALPRRRPRQRPRSVRCGGELIAFSLAGRAPPLGR